MKSSDEKSKKEIDFVALCQNIKDEGTKQYLLDLLNMQKKVLEPLQKLYDINKINFQLDNACMCLSSVHLRNNPLDTFFDITNTHIEESLQPIIERAQQQISNLKKEENNKYILGGIYNALMPNGNTFFHSAIASDLTNKTLQILQHISTIAQQNNTTISTLVPFCQLDRTDNNDKMNKWVAKNFLMLAIAKKYDNTLNDFCDGVETKFNYKEKYQQEDYALVKWLIDNAPEECITQTDSEGYNLVDYALMKMDKEVLKKILKRNINLLDQSKIWKNFQNFDYKKAKELLDNRYNKPIAITEARQWNLQKQEIKELLDTINNAKNDKEKLEASLEEEPVKPVTIKSSEPNYTIHNIHDKNPTICCSSCNVF